MQDITYYFNIEPSSIYAMLAFALVIMLLEFLISQKKYPNLSNGVLMLSPFLMIVVFCYFSIINARYIIYSNIVAFLPGLASLPLGLIYAVRCFRVDLMDMRWVGRVFSFLFMALMVWFVLAYVNYALSDLRASFRVPDYLLVPIFIAVMGLWALFLRKLDMRSLRQRRSMDFQCIHCGRSLQGSMHATRCPECGGEIEQQQSQSM